jgi:plastocyanin
MTKLLTLIMAMLAGVAAGRAGTITGTVRAAPPPTAPEAAGGAGGGYDSRRYKFVEKLDYEHLRDFVVYIDKPAAADDAAATQAPAVTTQRDANFEPHVVPIAVGGIVRWPNADDIFHNVYSMADVKQFDLGFYKKEKVPEIKFDEVGRVDVFCAIHTKMHCIILVVPNRHFTMADGRGRFVIKDVPAGTYKLRAWHERLPSQTREIVVPAEGEVQVDFTLGVGQLPRY